MNQIYVVFESVVFRCEKPTVVSRAYTFQKAGKMLKIMLLKNIYCKNIKYPPS